MAYRNPRDHDLFKYHDLLVYDVRTETCPECGQEVTLRFLNEEETVKKQNAYMGRSMARKLAKRASPNTVPQKMRYNRSSIRQERLWIREVCRRAEIRLPINELPPHTFCGYAGG